MLSAQTSPDVPHGGCDGCTVAVRLAASSGDAVVCVCGVVHLAPGLDDVRMSPRLEVRDVSGRTVRDPQVSRRRFERQHDEESVTGLRRLLCELRPDAGGPFGWGPEAAPPKRDEDPLGALANRIRVQSSTIVPAILPTAFASEASTTRGALVARLLDREVSRLTDLLTMSADALARSGATGEARPTLSARLRGTRALVWLQRNGTLRSGAEVLYSQLAEALAEPSRRERWATSGVGAWRGSVAWGAARCIEAAGVWEALGDRARVC